MSHTRFIPAGLAPDVATTAIGKNNLPAPRLPGPWVMVLNEPVPLALSGAPMSTFPEALVFAARWLPG